MQYIFKSSDGDLDLDKDLSLKEKDTIKSSMVLIRRLLLDAQTKFRIMVEDNKHLAARIDGSIHAANQEVTALRAELADTNKRLTEIDMSANNKKDASTQADGECELNCNYFLSLLGHYQKGVSTPPLMTFFNHMFTVIIISLFFGQLSYFFPELE